MPHPPYQAGQPVNELRRRDVVLAFQEAAGRRAFILINPFPFMVIGEIVGVANDYLQLIIETTSINELEGRTINLHIDEVEVFYIELDGPPIPRIENAPGGRTKRGDRA